MRTRRIERVSVCAERVPSGGTRSVAEQQHIESPCDLIVLAVQRRNRAPELPDGNCDDRLGQHDMPYTLDLENRIQLPDRPQCSGLRRQRYDGAYGQMVEQTRLDIDNIACSTLAGCRMDIEARHQNWRNSVSGSPCGST